MTHVLVVADDFTGACEVAAVFARPQTPVSIAVDGLMAVDGAPPNAAVRVVNTETRHAGAEEARAKIEARLRPWLEGPEAILYKKIDSTLRGPVAAETEALRCASGCAGVLVAPALPAEGRTTVAARQLLWGVPLEDAAAGQDPVGAAATSHIPTLLRRQAGVSVGTIGMETVERGAGALTEALRWSFSQNGYCVVDAATEQHLAVIARSAQDLPKKVLLVGTAGLARHLAKSLRPAADTDAKAPPPKTVGSAGILILCGSMNPVNREQLDVLKEWETVHTITLTATAGFAASQERAAAHLATAHLALQSPAGRAETGVFADAIAQYARRLITATKPRCIFVTGGETAYRTLRALSASEIVIQGEVAPGLPFGFVQGGSADRLPIITKAGGFGGKNALLHVVRHLSGEGVDALSAPS
jgi:uncharacterized protein YgbK (DUF1537 family)